MEHADISPDEVDVVRVERSVEVDAPIAAVWRSLSRPDELGRWLGVEVDVEGDEVDGEVDDDADPALAPGRAARLLEPDGSARHLLVTDVEEGRRLAWHWWRTDGELSAVEITIETTGETSVVRVVETLALASSALAGGGRAHLDLAAGIDQEWGVRLGALGTRLGAKLGLAVPR
jgi:uncharacterized protein YndB with AHSA1/START domain